MQKSNSNRWALRAAGVLGAIVMFAVVQAASPAAASIWDSAYYGGPGAKCAQYGGYSYSSYNNSEGKKNDTSRRIYIKDYCGDSRSIVVQVWVKVGSKYEHFQNVWNRYGKGKMVSQKLTLPKGDLARFRICRGQYTTKKITDCSKVYQYTHA